MRTSKKLLSFFLALVMVITSCSVGFTALAASDGNQTDANNSYWNNTTEAEDAFDTINTLLGMAIQLDLVKNLLEENNIVNPVTQTTTLSDVVYGASPMLLSLLTGLGTLDLSAIGGPTVQLRQSKSDFLSQKFGTEEYASKRDYYNLWYQALDGDEDDLLDFYGLYGICEKNQDADGDFGEFCKSTLKALDKLFDSIPAPVEKPVEKAESEILAEKANAWLDEVASEASVGQSYMLPVLEDYEVASYNGATLADFSADDIAETDGKYLLDYYNNLFSKLGMGEITNLAQLLYYARGDYSKYNVIYNLYFNLIQAGGGTVDTSVLGVDGETAREVADNFHATTDYWNELNTWGYIAGLNLMTWDDSLDGPPFEEYFDAYTLNQLFFLLTNGKDMSDISGIGDIASGYYKEMTKGMAVQAGLDVDGLELTDAQWSAIAGSGAADAAALREFVNASDVSDAVKGYFNALSDSALNGLAADGAFSDDEQSTFDEMGFTTAKDRINAMVYSQALIDSLLWESQRNTYVNSNITSELNVYAFYLQYIANDPGEEPDNSEPYYPYEGPTYEYVDYAIPENLYLYVVNALINDFLNLLDMDLIQGLFSGLSTDIDLHQSLEDLWIKLYNQPAETVFELVPLLTVIIDEMLLPMFLREEVEGEEQNLIEGLLMGLLGKYTQTSGSDVGIGQLHFDLNKSLPAILHFLTGDQAGALAMIGYKFHGPVQLVDENGDPMVDEDGNPVMKEYDSRVPKFLNIYIVDGFVAQAGDGNGVGKALAGLIKKDDPDGQAELAPILGEVMTELLSFLREAVDTYMAEHAEDTRYIAASVNDEYVVAPSQKGLNNLSVALPQLIDIIGKKFMTKYNVDSDWAFAYDGKIEMQTVTFEADRENLSATELVNTHFQTFKDFAAVDSKATPADILAQFVDLLIGNWINALLDFLNDNFMDSNADNQFIGKLPLLQGLLEALGGFGEKSIITDVFNGLFQLKRSDAASFTMAQRSTGFVGFSNESGFFLISNILFIKDGEQRGLIPFIQTIIANNENVKANYDLSTALTPAVAPLLANSKKANVSAAGTDYDKLLTKKNIDAANTLVDALDDILASLLSNTSLNGFDLDSTDNLLASIFTVGSRYLGKKNTNQLTVLLNNFFYYVNGEACGDINDGKQFASGPDENGDIDVKKVYTAANLSNFVIQLYSLVENLVDYLFYNEDSGFLKNRDPNMLIADALYGLISPDAVAIRLSDEYSATAKILQQKEYRNWNDFKVEITALNRKSKPYSKNYLKFKFDNGDKDAFFNGLGESLSGIAGVLGAILVTTYTDTDRSGNWYSEVVYPLFNALGEAVGAGSAMAPADFNKASAPEQLIQGILLPVGSFFDQLFPAPATFILNVVKGLGGVLEDNTFSKIANGALAPINLHINGIIDIISNFSPSFAQYAGYKLSEGIHFTLPKDNIAITVINKLLDSFLSQNLGFSLPNADFARLNKASTPGEVLLLVYAYVVDTILHSDLLTTLVNSLDPNIIAIISNLSAAQILDLLLQIIDVVKDPTQVYWTFSEYAVDMTGNFRYPKEITSARANRAVDQLDTIVENIFPLLSQIGILNVDGLGSVVNDALYTNEIITTIATALYKALNSNATVTTVLGVIGMDVTPAGVAAYLTDKSYGKTYSAAAKTLKSVKSWDDVKSLNWGFTNGTAAAKQGFINGLAAALRPLNGVLSVLLAEGKLGLIKNLDIKSILKMLATDVKETEILTDKGELAATLTYQFTGKKFILTIQAHGTTGSNHRTEKNKLIIDVDAIADDLAQLLNNIDVTIGTNGYESAIVPLLEAFMCDGVKTYSEYKKDYAAAKDNLIIDILNPIGNFLDTLLASPFNTINGILPNLANFINGSGVSQVVANLLAPITSEEGLIGVLKKNGLDIDELIEAITGKSLGQIVADFLGMDKAIDIKLTNLAALRIQDLVVPLINSLIAQYGIVIPDFDWATLASHGDLKTVKSAAKNADGKYETQQVTARKGEVLVAVLRYLGDTIITNAPALKALLGGLLGDNETIGAVVNCILDQVSTADKDDIVRAIFYLLDGQVTTKYFDYSGFKAAENNFSYGDLRPQDCAKIAPAIDSILSTVLGMFVGTDLGSLVADNLYTDSLVNTAATGIYGAVEGVVINESLGSLSDILKLAGIDMTTAGVAAALTDSRYGRTYEDAAAELSKADSWADVTELTWGVTDRDSFLHALTAALRPILGVLDVILNSGSLNLLNLISLPGSNGYASAIVPLLEAFDIFDVKSEKQYAADIEKEYDAILLDILNPLWDKVEELMAAPVETLMSMLPTLAHFFANDGHLQVIDNLLTPITALLDAFRPIVDINNLLDAAGLDVKALLKDNLGIELEIFDIYDLQTTLKGVIGSEAVIPIVNKLIAGLGFQLPAIDWFELASHGELEMVKSAVQNAAGKFTAPRVEADITETTVAVLRYLVNTIIQNIDAIKGLVGGLLGDNETLLNVLNSIFDNIANAEPDEVINAIIYLIAENVTHKYFEYRGFRNYSYDFSYGDLDANACAQLASALDALIDTLLGTFAGSDLTSFVGEKLYSDSLINTIATALYPAIEGVVINDSLGSLTDVLKLAEIDTSTEGVAAMLTDESYGWQYADAAKAIAAAGSWKNVKADDLSWGVKDRDTFMHALVAVLRPLYGVLDVILSDGSLNLLNIVSLPGSNGYTSAIVPLLEAFDIFDVKSQKQYDADIEKEYDAILLDILNPLWDKVEEILAAPIETLADILPTLAHFIANDGVIQALDNLLTPVTALLEAFRPIVDVNEVLVAAGLDVKALLKDNLGIELETFDIYNLQKTLKGVIGSEQIIPLVNKLIAGIEVGGSKLGLQLPAIDWYQLASHGKLQTVDSMVLNNAGEYTAPRVEADRAETLTAVLRYLAGTIIQNMDAIKTLVGGLLGDNATLQNILNSIFDNIANAESDDIIQALIALLAGDCTDKFFDYRNFKYKEYEFSFGELDEDFCRQLAPMLDGLVKSLLYDGEGLPALVNEKLYNDALIGKLVTGLYGAIEGVKVNDSLGTLTDILKNFADIDMSTAGVAKLLTDSKYGQSYAAAARTIGNASSWKNVKAEKLSFGVNNRDSFLHALAAALRPLYGVLDVLLNNDSLKLLNAVKVPGSDGYTSSIVPLLEAFGVYNIKTQYDYRKDIAKEYDAILLDILNPLWDKVEDILEAPVEMLMDILPNLSLFFANDGLIQLVDNLLTPISALLEQLRPIVDVNDLLVALGVNVPKLLKDKVGITISKFDLYDLPGTLKPVVGAENVVPLLNTVLKNLEVGGKKLNLELPEIDWYQLASHGEFYYASSQAATHGTRIAVKADQDETFIAVLRYLIETINYKDNYDKVVDLVGGLVGDNETVAGVVGNVFGLLQGETDQVIKDLVELLQSLAG